MMGTRSLKTVFLIIGILMLTTVFCASDRYDEPQCAICFDTFTKEQIVLQTECRDGASHGFHLGCLYRHIEVKHRQRNTVLCPVCNSPLILHDPATQKNNYTNLSNYHVIPSGEDQRRLRTIFSNGSVKTSKIKLFLPITRQCSGCCEIIPHDQIFILFSCSHGACFEDARHLLFENQPCPTCRFKIRKILDPIRLNTEGEIVIAHQGEPVPEQERDTLMQLRDKVTLYQEHLPLSQQIGQTDTTEENNLTSQEQCTLDEPLREITPEVTLIKKNNLSSSLPYCSNEMIQNETQKSSFVGYFLCGIGALAVIFLYKKNTIHGEKNNDIKKVLFMHPFHIPVHLR